MSEHDSGSNLKLARLAAEGDGLAFEALFARFRDHLRRFIDLRLDDRIRARVDPSDVLQETQIEVHRRLRDYLHRNPMPLRVWLRKSAEEQMIAMRDKHLRAAKRSVTKEAQMTRRSSMQLARRLAAKDPSPSQQLAIEERRQKVANAISQLRDDDREMLLMRNIESLGFNEIAATLNINAATARQRYGRAMLRLRRQIDGLESGEA